MVESAPICRRLLLGNNWLFHAESTVEQKQSKEVYKTAYTRTLSAKKNMWKHIEIEYECIK